MLSQTVRGYGPINHSVIGPALVIIHPGPLILDDVKGGLLYFGICHGCIFLKRFVSHQMSYKSK